LPNGAIHEYCFIPSRIIDNQILMEMDPQYVNRLQLVGSPELVRAWLEGDWSAIEGNYFPEFGSQHIVAPHEIPAHWTRIGGFDWGSASPFAMLWGAVSDGTDDRYPKNALIIYREYYGALSPNVGLKMPNPQIGYEIAMREKGENVAYRKADPSIFKMDGGPSIAEQMRDDVTSGKVGVTFLPADNTRVAGWAQVRQRLQGDGERPALYIFSTCINLIRTFPMMVHDENKPEDLDTNTDDHCLAARTLIDTEFGPMPIINMLGTSIKVRTLSGYVTPVNIRRTRFAECITLTFDNGDEVTCTPDHLFADIEGNWICAQNLLGKTLYQSQIPSNNSRARTIGVADSTFNDTANACTVQFGNIITDQFRKAITSTTRTRTGRTIPWTTLNCFPALNIWNFTEPMRHIRRFAEATLRKLLQQLQHGTQAKQAKNGIGSITQSIAKHCTHVVSVFAKFAIRHFQASGTVGFAQITANLSGEDVQVLTEKPALVSPAAVPLPVTSIRVSKIVRESAGLDRRPRPKCVRIESAKPRAVYCMTVPQHEHFFLANGLLSHNCLDSLRYLCMARPYMTALKAAEPSKDVRNTTLKTFMDPTKVRKRGLR
jgi:hypothetical protein